MKPGVPPPSGGMKRVESTSLLALGPNSHHRSGSQGRCERIRREAALSGGCSWEVLSQVLSEAPGTHGDTC